MTSKSLNRRTGALVAGAWGVLLAGVACGQSYSTTCSDTRSCRVEPAGGGAGGEGAEEGEAGETASTAGAPGMSGAGGGGGNSDESCPGGCADGEACCDGECVDTTSDVENCGACGARCEEARAESECVASRCAIRRCEDGFVDCAPDDGGCESEDAGLPGVPAPFLPMAGAYTGAVRAESSLTPKFAWRAPDGQGTCGSVSYEIELTRECAPGTLQECAFEDPEVRETGIPGTEWTPGMPLPVSETAPVGALYAWRVRACDAPEHCSSWSRVSYVNVGRLIDDIDADGDSDLIELARGGVWWSNGDSLAPLGTSSGVPESVVDPKLAINRGRYLGDVDGDHFPDLLLWSTSGGAPIAIFGAGTLSAWRSARLPEATFALCRSGRAGDLDADGFADIAIGEVDGAQTGQKPGALRLYRGGSTFAWTSPVTVLGPEEPSLGFAAALTGGLDSNGDGYSDLVVLDEAKGVLHFLSGGPSLPSASAATLESEALVSVRRDLSDLMVLGDWNGDGYDDVGAYVVNVDDPFENSVIQIFLGGFEPSPEPAANLVLSAKYGLEWFGGYDLGADGRADLILSSISDDTYGYYLGDFRALPGSSSEQSASDLIQVGDLGSRLSNSGLSGGDYDGDGALDLTVRMKDDRRILRGGTTAPTSPTCSQPATSFPKIGDWCSVESDVVLASSKYSNPSMTVR